MIKKFFYLEDQMKTQIKYNSQYMILLMIIGISVKSIKISILINFILLNKIKNYTQLVAKNWVDDKVKYQSMIFYKINQKLN